MIYSCDKNMKKYKNGHGNGKPLATPEPKANEKVILYLNIALYFDVSIWSTCTAG